MEQPQWLRLAWAEFGVRETAGGASTSAVLSYFRDAGHATIRSDEVAWCAAFAGAMLKRAGVKPSGSLMARSYLAWGARLETPKLGAIAVLTRGSDPAAGHVGFYLGEAGGRIFLLGGNQSDGVTVGAFEVSRLLGYRWPASSAPAAPIESDIFKVALVHVLKMEGGFGDDPYDPGGPTNRGITLEDFARSKGVSVTAHNRASLIDELKQISDSAVEAIYRDRYWRPARCAELSPPLALMHFDAAVNHGVGGAIRMLQQVAAVTVDGDIGPETLSALGKLAPMDAVDRYAQLRRERYRALPTFWRFGKGWLNRVAATRATAAEMPALPNSQTATPKGPLAMTGANDSAPKSWAQSKTIWGALITAAATVLPALGPVIGIDLPGDSVRQAGEQTISAVQAVTGLLGTLLTIYGRSKAKQGIVWTR